MRFLFVLPFSVLCFAAFQPVATGAALDAAQAGTVGGASPVTAIPAARTPAAVRAAERRRAQAVATRDVAALRPLISGDYHHVESNGRTRTKTEFLQLLSRDAFEFRAYDVQDMEIRMLDDGRAALVMGRFRAEVNDQNRPRALRGRFVRMWVLGPEGWRNTMQQSTEIRPLSTRRQPGARP